MIPTGRRYTSTITGWVWRPVRCEKCGCEFAYKLKIVAQGQGYSPLFLNNSGAKSSAQDKARQNFDRKAKSDITAVNCPDCAHLQPEMVKLLKNKRRKLLLGPAVALAIVLFFLFWPSDYFDFMVLIIAGVILAVDGIAMVLNGAIVQSVYVFGVLAVLALWGFNGPDLMFYMAPLGVLDLMADAYFAFTYDPLTKAWRPGPKLRYQMVIARRAEFEAAAAQLKAEKGQTVAIPQWP